MVINPFLEGERVTNEVALLSSVRIASRKRGVICLVKTTDYHSKCLAHELTRRCSSDSVEKLTAAVAGAQVDLNPHQVDAALFAFSSPLSKGGRGKGVRSEWHER